MLADKGNGNYAYIDDLREARKVLVEELTGTLVTIAKDVKIQIEFNPAKVAGYRLVGYENRMLRTEDFNDDKKDAGEIGAGHTVTALYEIVPAGKNVGVAPVDELKYQKRQVLLTDGNWPEARPQSPENASDELLTLKMRYKAPDGDTSKKLEWPVKDDAQTFSDASDDYQFAAAVAGFGLMLRDSQYKGNLKFPVVLELAQGGLGRDEKGYRSEFLDMVQKAQQLKGE
jgi:Ca-activated chloride channel family protein